MRAKEKRLFIRLTVYHLTKYKPLSGTRQISTPVLASLKNISAGGACLRTQEYLPISSLLELRINFPTFEHPLSCLAKVVWIKKIGRPGHYELGVQFQDLDVATRKAIDEGIKFVKQKLSQRK